MPLLHQAVIGASLTRTLFAQANATLTVAQKVKDAR